MSVHFKPKRIGPKQARVFKQYPERRVQHLTAPLVGIALVTFGQKLEGRSEATQHLQWLLANADTKALTR